MPRNNKAFGAAGEQATVRYLESHGYTIVDTNVRPLGGMRRGEIDIVAWSGETLAIIEVKTRRSQQSGQGTAVEAIDYRKRRQLLRLAMAYVAKYKLTDVPIRFDLVTAITQTSGPLQISVLQHAFDAGDC